jgi:(1->4)-alpha-D-glucan 1-alpha-D-glucosylmutase
MSAPPSDSSGYSLNSQTRRATYRLQLHAGFGLDDAATIVDYLARLGVSHLYTSPYLQAAAGSTHGYDVVDHGWVNTELGGPAAHRRFLAELRAVGLRQLIDIVPNHMAIAAGNRWWWDVLENGPASHFAAHFDVDWDPPESRLRNVVLLPVLAEHYGRVLEAGGLRVFRAGADFRVAHGDDHFPADPRSLESLLADAEAHCRDDRLAFLADAYATLPVSTATDVASVRRRHRDKTILHADLERLLGERADLAAAVDDAVSRLNADVEALDSFLEQQNYRLAWWRAAGRDLGYRRFFDINTLIGLRTENERVFEDTHALVLEWVKQGSVDGLRVDHVDGLGDPEQYLRRLRASTGNAWIVVEKILEGHEAVRQSWPVDGTTGYDFLARVGNLFVDPLGEAPLTALYQAFTGDHDDYVRIARDSKHMVLRDILGSDVNRLAALFLEICERHRRYRDYTRHELTEALREAIIAFPVYRTYVQPEAGEAGPDDAAVIHQALEAAEKTRPDLDPTLLHFLRDILLGRIPGRLEAELLLRFQQLTGPVMAKGIEDTAFYRYGRFVALNEVGGAPDRFGVSVDEFHAANLTASRRSPHGLLATSTHDTKRGEDVRARLALLSEIPGRWSEAVTRWSALAQRHRRGDWPDRVMEYVFYQTLVGAWPLGEDRALQYVEKASREAKHYTSWTAPNDAYDAALQAFVKGCLGDSAFMESVHEFTEPLVEPGRATSLAQTLLKLTAPGVPDIYQGTELWALHLVDPDNRTPVDYEQRRLLLEAVERATLAEILGRADEGLPKLWVVRQALHARRREPDVFDEGAYEPLSARGARAGHVVAFVRGARALTVVPRLVLTLGGDWADTTLDLPAGSWHDELTGADMRGGAVRLAELLGRFPVALLVQRDAR